MNIKNGAKKQFNILFCRTDNFSETNRVNAVWSQQLIDLI